MPWQPRDGTSPYGRPAPKGNADDLWRRASNVPCPTCGAASKQVSIEKDRATIRCTSEKTY